MRGPLGGAGASHPFAGSADFSRPPCGSGPCAPCGRRGRLPAGRPEAYVVGMREELLIDLRRTQLLAVDTSLDDARRALVRAARIPTAFAAEVRALLLVVADLERRELADDRSVAAPLVRAVTPDGEVRGARERGEQVERAARAVRRHLTAVPALVRGPLALGRGALRELDGGRARRELGEP